MKYISHILFVLLLVMLAGCEKPIISDTDTEETVEKKGNLTLTICEVEHTPFPELTRKSASSVPPRSSCPRVPTSSWHWHIAVTATPR